MTASEWIGSWNTGGVNLDSLDLLVSSLRAIGEQHDAFPTVVALQEVSRGDVGWTVRKDKKWQLVSHQSSSCWRGTGLLFDSSVWVILRRKATEHGVWFRLRHLSTMTECWVGSLYIAPFYTTTYMQGIAVQHFRALPATTLPVLLGSDVNARVKWKLNEEGVPCSWGDDCKGRALLDVLPVAHFQLHPHEDSHLNCPTSRPRKFGAEGHLIDWFATKHMPCNRVRVCSDSCHQIGTDHDMLCVSLPLLHARRNLCRVRTGKRRVVSRVGPQGKLDQQILSSLARAHTAPPRGQGYRDPPRVRALFSHARATREPLDWKLALRSRKEEQTEWKRRRICQAVAGDWQAVKSMKIAGGQGWEVKFANNVAPDEPHHLLHAHFSDTFSCPFFSSALSTSPPRSPDITEEELTWSLQAGKSGCSVGIDGVSLELIRDIAGHREGMQGLLDWFNRILHTGVIPEQWRDVLLILLPKTDSPAHPRQTRGIAMGCSAEKIFTRILLQRAKPLLPFSEPWQCSAPSRQSMDLVFCLHRLAEIEREWGRGVCILKLDLRAAFDNVARDRLLQQLFQRLGDSEEFRVWEQLLTESYCTLQSPWDVSRFPTQRGIRQGAIESPYFFGLLVEWIISAVASRYSWPSTACTYHDLHLSQVAFMDDVYLWEGRCELLEKRANQLRQEFLEWGLQVNAEKSALYLSPKHEGKAELKLGSVILRPQVHLPVMGLPLRVGANAGELLQPVWQQAKNRFWSLRHLLLSDAPLGDRLRLFNKVVGASALWCSSALHPETAALIQINAVMYQLILYMLKLRKGNGESWEDHRRRGIRQARQLTVLHLGTRWSSVWLSRWWGYQGHVIRSQSRDVPLGSSKLACFRPLEWWRLQQQSQLGARHNGRYHPKLHALDTQMNIAAQGEWRVIAMNRDAWKSRAQTWINQQDVPWNSGMQLALDDV